MGFRKRPRAAPKREPAKDPPRAVLKKRAASDDPHAGAADFARDLAASNVRARGGWEIDDSIRVVPSIFPGLNRASVSGYANIPGGIMMGSTMILRGSEQGGKSAVAVGLMASVQRAGGVAALCEAPGEAFDMGWAVRLGLARERFVMLGRVDQDAKVPPPFYIEAAYKEIDCQIDKYVTAGSRFPFMIVVDSLTKMIPKASMKRLEKDGDARSASVGRDQAQYNTTWVKDLGPKIADHNISVVFIVHDHAEDQDGNSKMKGGKGIRYDATLVLAASFAGRTFDLSRDADGSQPVGKKHRVKVEKTKMGPALLGDATSFEFFISPQGFDRPREILNETVRRAALAKGEKCDYGLSFTLGSRFNFDGRDYTLKQLAEDPVLLTNMERALR